MRVMKNLKGEKAQVEKLTEMQSSILKIPISISNVHDYRNNIAWRQRNKFLLFSMVEKFSFTSSWMGEKMPSDM